MNTFWLKIAGAAIVAVVGIMLVGMLISGSPQEPEPPEKTFYDQAEQDKQRFLAEPQALDSAQQEPVPQQEVAAQEGQAAPEPSQPVAEPSKPAGPMTLYFKELSEIDGIEAERLLDVAAPARSIGRLPTTGFKLMVDSCRQIIQRWPDSWYEYRAKQMLADMPERHRQRYSITQQELDMTRFAKPRFGTKPFTVEESR
ncbi:MAG: hypothetical protein JSW66_11315 [Phycisphaerales bacterium]|nr:MAG: hypothetical protein JSW66_11315 [Phycisphaerales bacterium]